MLTRTRVLIIDNDRALTEMLGLLLRSHGYEVLTSNTGRDGIRLVQEQRPAVVIVDLMMPDFDGWEVCRSIRSFSNVPVLVVSAINDPRKIASVLDEGADDFLVKPVASNVLMAHVRKLVRRTGVLQRDTESVTPADARTGTRTLAS